MRTLIRTFLVVTLLSLFTGSVVLAQQSVVLSIPICKVYNINLKGQVDGNTFERTGQLGIYKPGLTGKNVQEVWIASGDPETNPSKGAIRYTSNSYFAFHDTYSKDKYHMAWVSIYADSGAFNMKPNPYILDITAGMVNLYTKTSMPGSQEEIAHGYLDVQFLSGGKISGWIDLLGAYQADFEGSLYSSTIFGNCQFRNN